MSRLGPLGVGEHVRGPGGAGIVVASEEDGWVHVRYEAGPIERERARDVVRGRWQQVWVDDPKETNGEG